MFNIGNFLMKTLNGMIGNYPDFQVREYALNWYAKGKLTEEDLASIDASIEAQYIVPEPPVVEDDTTTTEEPISADDIAGGVIEETTEDSTNEESTEQTEEAVEETE